MKAAALLAVVVGTALLAGSAAVFGLHAPARSAAIAPVWTEVKWPFPVDQWGTGRAFVCAAADCDTEVHLYVRPKIGFCNCATGVSDDAELERVADTELISRGIAPLDQGRPIKVGWMEGRIRAYRSSGEVSGEQLLSAAFNDECDVVVAVAALKHGDPAVIGPAVLSYLNTTPMVLWAKKELGLEFVSRQW
ncbi:MAG TPA: hypothetical protein VKW08_05475 [Xanthobacteraceae bacterium]|jgi:hypothetical protein|nr:hypothetical protein [Xanthobacteraceae bacterium]